METSTTSLGILNSFVLLMKPFVSFAYDGRYFTIGWRW